MGVVLQGRRAAIPVGRAARDGCGKARLQIGLRARARQFVDMEPGPPRRSRREHCFADQAKAKAQRIELARFV
jgi:hypothetical protein